MKIKVTYDERIDSVLDKKIREFFKSLGYKWTGQGRDFTTNIRDISFEGVWNDLPS